MAARDERLLCFGFRPSIMRRNQRPTEEVTVVTEAATSEVATSEVVTVVETPIPAGGFLTE